MNRAAILLSMLLAGTLLGVSAPAVAQEDAICASAVEGGTLVELPPTGTGFGRYKVVPLRSDDRAYAGPRTPTDLADVTLSRQVRRQLSPRARAKLAKQGFVIVPAKFRLFHQAYHEQVWQGTPVFITTDIGYHTWHLVFDKVLRDLEQQQLLPALEELVAGMRQNAAAQVEELAGSPLGDDAARVLDLMAVTEAVLATDADTDTGAPTGTSTVALSDRAAEELALITDHDAATGSPILGTTTDYTLFTPRGHYTRTEDLTRYFTAMSVLGQHAFRLPGSLQTDFTEVGDADGMRLALLASRTLVGHPELEALWRTVFEPTAFLVGVSDDYTPFEMVEAVEATVSGGMAEPLTATSEASLVAVADALKVARPVQIDPERPSVRLMGTRFVLDAWILDQMIGPCVGEQFERPLPSALDLAAAFGSSFALGIQKKAGETAIANYPEQMRAMRAAVEARPAQAWGNTVYDAWLAAVEPMWLPRREAFPDFMRGPSWRAKAHQTGLGSYAELRHDTILYTKQSVGEGGNVGTPPPARNWVEPDPVAFKRMSAMAALMREGLDARGLLSGEGQNLVSGYIRMIDRFAGIAAAELAGAPISRKDNRWLKSIGGVFEGFWWRTGDHLDGYLPVIDDDAAIVADIARGIFSDKDEVLEIGTGRIDRIFVIVPDDAGDFYVASGGVYSYYEFPWPSAGRLNDEQWLEMLKSGEVPDRPAWQRRLFP